MEALRALEEASKKHKVVFLSAPTSFGKSGVSIGLLNSYEAGGNSMILTGTKALSAQYLRDFELYEMRGRGNYRCAVSGHLTAAQGPCTRIYRYNCSSREDCPYFIAKAEAAASMHVVTNYDYMLYEGNYAGMLVPRDWAVADEAHMLEQTILDFVEVDFSEKSLGPLGIELPNIHIEDTPAWQSWAQGLQLQLMLQLNNARKEQEEGATWIEPEALAQLKKLIDTAKRFAQGDTEQWIVEERPRGVAARPVWAKDYFKPFFRRHFDKVLLMSATMFNIERVAKWLGIEEPFQELHFGSNIKLEDRPFYFLPVLKMGRKSNIDPRLITQWIDMILDAYYPLPALIHTVSNDLRNIVLNWSKHRKAMISHGQADREMACKKYVESSGFRVLVSPSMFQGADFPGVQGVQIIPKLPFPSLGDRRIRIRKDQDPGWYNWATASALHQTYGRGSRVPGHLCDTICLDDNLRWFKNQNKDLMQPWLTQAVMPVSAEPDKAWEFLQKRGNYLRRARAL